MRARASAGWAMGVSLGLVLLGGCEWNDEGAASDTQYRALAAGSGGADGGQGPGGAGSDSTSEEASDEDGSGPQSDTVEPWAAMAPGLGEVEVAEQTLEPGDESTQANLGMALCDADQSVVGGGCNCNGQTLIGSRMDENGWSCACASGAGQKALAVCAQEQVTVSRATAPFRGTEKDAKVECPAGTHLLAVGVHCGFSGPNGPNGPTGNHGESKSVLPNDPTHASGHCGTTSRGGGTPPRLDGYCASDAGAGVKRVSTMGSNTSTCEDGMVVIGGGCQCDQPDSGVLQGAYVDGNGFSCSCKDLTANETVAVCAEH